MAKTWRYMELNRIIQLRNGGRELLGKYIYFTEKRDGSCLVVWLKDIPKTFLQKLFRNKGAKKFMVSSRNQEQAEKSIRTDFLRCETKPLVFEYLKDNPTHIIFGELLRQGLSPTRIEDHGNTVEFIVFDIFNGEGFLPYQCVYQTCYHYGMKCVELFGEGRFTSMESLFKYRDKMLKICKKHKREGVVLKALGSNNEPIYAKEKLDVASPRGHPKIEKGNVQYSPLPLSEAQGAVDKAYADLGEEFSDKSKAMPMIVAYIKKEMDKHMCSRPEADYFKLYCDYCEDHNIIIKEKVKTKENSIVKKIVEKHVKSKPWWKFW